MRGGVGVGVGFRVKGLGFRGRWVLHVFTLNPTAAIVCVCVCMCVCIYIYIYVGALMVFKTAKVLGDVFFPSSLEAVVAVVSWFGF